MADLPPLPPRKTDQPRELPPRPAAAPARASGEAAKPKPGKPDPRPMRMVYGAGAVAVVSVIAVGLVQPDFAATADQQATNDPGAVADANGAGDPATAAPTDSTTGGQGSHRGKGRSDQSTPGTQPDVQVNHVTKYIHLKPGQTAPPGATVITPGAPTPKVFVAHQPVPSAAPPANHPPANTPPPNNPPPNNPPATKPPVNNPPPVHTAPPPPPPTPRPTVKTHQSGHP